MHVDLYNCCKRVVCIVGVSKSQTEKLVPCGTDGRLILSGFQALATLTLTLDWVIQHTVVHQSSTVIYTVSQKNVPLLQLAIIFTYSSIATIFGINVAKKVGNQNVFIFPPHLTSASALPGDTGKPEIASFHLNASCFFTKKHETQLKISPGQNSTTLHCQNDRLGAPDST